MTKSRICPFTGDTVIAIEYVPQWPPEWGVKIGEVGYNLRAALDYLVFQLSGEGGEHPENSRTAFPISEQADDYWRTRGKRKSYRDQCLADVDAKWAEQINLYNHSISIPG